VIVFVVNEKSGNGRGLRVWEAVERELLERGTDYVKITAETAAEAQRQAEERLCVGRVTALVAVGGDGTLHGLLPLSVQRQVPVGLIPGGSGNDTALAFGLPKDPAAALDIALGGHTRRADVVTTRRPDGTLHYSFISVAIGLDGAVADDVNGSRYKEWCNLLGLGSLAYIIGLFRMLTVYKPQTIAIKVDGVRHEFRQSWLAAVANLATYGGGLKICPGAKPDDGLIHVCVVHGCTALQLLRVFPTVLKGTHVRSRYVTMLQGTEVSVESPVPLLAYGDGEPAGHTPVIAAIRPAQLLFLTAASG
jgi:YegS/Rv2252/BmrU family lipid kinase